MIELEASVHPSLSEIVTENLRRRNVVTIVDFVMMDPLKLVTFSGLSHADVMQVKQHILNKYSGTRKTAPDLLSMECNHKIPTNIICLDELLKGGLYPGQLCELCGLSSSGKTQLCLTIAANVVGQSDIIAWYFDTKRDFSRLRYDEILKARNLSQKVIEDALQRTKVCYVHSSRDLIQALRQLLTFYKKENDKPLKERKPFLIIIDSLPAVIFQVTRDAHQVNYETIYELDDLAEVCRFLARECHAIVVTVNSITRWNSEQTDLAVTKPALGKYWMRIPVTRLLLTRQHGGTRRISVWKDLRLEENSSCIVTVTEAGII